VGRALLSALLRSPPDEWDDRQMASDADAAQDWVVLASFPRRHAAEHMLASLRRGLRTKARKGQVTALVISGNKDGSVKVTRSRLLTASGFVYTLLRISASLALGFMGLFPAAKGIKSGAAQVQAHKSRVGSDDERVHELIENAGPHAAILLVLCDDQDTRQTVAARAAERAIESWDGSRADFLATLDPGSKHDWVRAAVGEP
jgi:uncharacterized membrane protein